MTSLLSLLSNSVPLSIGRRAPFEVPQLPLFCSRRATCEEHELPLSYGQRVTFFAGAKKVTKETPSRAEPAQEDMIGYRKACEEPHVQLGLRRPDCAPSECKAEAKLNNRCAPHPSARFRLRRTSCLANRFPVRKISARRICETEFLGLRRTSCLANRLPVRKISARRICETELLSLRRTSCPWDVSRACRISVRPTWARSDSERCFFGDFLCTGKESYPLAAGQRKLSHFKSCPPAKGQRKLSLLESYPVAAGQRKLSHFKSCPPAKGQRKLSLPESYPLAAGQRKFRQTGAPA